MNCLQRVNTRRCEERGLAHLAPADAEPVWQQRIRISLTAGDNAFAKDDMVAEDKLLSALTAWAAVN